MANKLINILREYIPKKKHMEIEVSHAINKKYTCANPDGPVSNFGCPEEDPLCNCPCKDLIPTTVRAVTMQWALDHIWEFSSNTVMTINMESATNEETTWVTIKGVYEDKSLTESNEDDQTTTGGNNPTYELFPDDAACFHTSQEDAVDEIETAYEETGGYTMDEPADLYLNTLLKKSSECDAISSEFDSTWLGCDWNDPNSPMSCDCPCVGENYTKYLRYNTSVSTFWDTPGYVPLIASAQKEALGSQKIGVTIHGDLTIRPGDIIQLDLMDTPHGFEEIEKIARKYGIVTELDKNAKFHGKWMVSTIRHKMYGVAYHKMDLILIRDGLPSNLSEKAITEESGDSTESNFVPIAPSGSNRIPASPSYIVDTQTASIEEILPEPDPAEYIEPEETPSTPEETPSAPEDDPPSSPSTPSYGSGY